jgi:hypothetical protein
MWLNRFFIETRQIFGAKPSVQNFDVLSNTLLTLTVCEMNVPKRLFHRTLDDIPLVCPAHKDWCKIFLQNFKKMCEDLNVKLAEDCVDFEKAFSCSTYGKVLGVFFDSERLFGSCLRKR